MLDSGMNEEEMVNQEFEELYPGKIERTQIVYNAKVTCQFLSAALTLTLLSLENPACE